MKLTYWIVGIVYGMISSIIRLYYTDTLFSSPINTLLDIYINSTLYSIGYEIVGSFINSIIPPKLHNYVLYFLIWKYDHDIFLCDLEFLIVLYIDHILYILILCFYLVDRQM